MIDPTDQANQEHQQKAADRSARWARTFAGLADKKEAQAVLADLKNLTLADDCPAHAAQFDANRTFYIAGRQAVWREIEALLTPPRK